MNGHPEIRRIKSLRKVGIFDNYRPDAAVPDFKRFNLVYGFNGSGKTTVTRILRGLDEGDVGSALPAGSQFELELGNGTVVRPDANVDALEGRLLVFNRDFINDNLRWSEGRANPVFYIGTDASRKSSLLERIEPRKRIREEQRRKAEQDKAAKEKALSTFYTDTARLIAEMLGLGRQYHAGNLKHDYESGLASNYSPLSEEEREDRKALIRQAGSYDKLDLPDLDAQALHSALEQARRISETTISDLTLQEIRDHPSMVPWLKSGLDYHQEHLLETCLFCGNKITEARFNALRGGLDERFDRFFSDIEATADKLRECSEALRSLPSRLPNERALSASLSRDYKTAVGQLRTSASTAQQTLELAASAIADKPRSPNSSNWPDTLSNAEDVERTIEALRTAFQQVLRLIEKHNQEQEDFTQRQQRARDELKFAVLIEHAAEHDTLCAQLAAASAAEQRRQRLYAKLVDRTSRLRADVRDHGPAVERINALLGAYLGHSEIQLVVFEEGYRILRHNEAITGPLSEGERTAIALCYFLSKLEEQGRILSQQIVVVDDPVSSLDAGSLNYAFNLIRTMLKDAHQLFIFTHNLPFMNETKKWLKKPRENGDASFYYIRTWQPEGQDRRHAVFIEMPKLLRAYDSEYQYLFSLVKKCVDEGVGSPDVPGYIMPNILRRVLELFLAFKAPGSEGLGDKINRPLVQNAGLDQPRIHALNRLTQVESHSDSLDDFIGFSAMTVEETYKAAQALLELIELLDLHHYERMCTLSN